MPLRLLSLFIPAAVFVVVAVGVFAFPAVVGWHVFEVASGNMEQTLPRGSYVAAHSESPERGDIIVYEQERGPEARGLDLPDQMFIKRAVAVGGDSIMCCEAGSVVLNGRRLEEPYVYEDDAIPFGPVTVPENRLFLLGDHRSQSRDSRSDIRDENLGSIASSDVIGVVGPASTRLQAHLQPVLYVAPYLAAFCVLLGLVLDLVLRSRSRQRSAPPDLADGWPSR